jgi:hypothetical protein
MEAALEWARGPLFLFAFSFMLLGLIRRAALTIWETVRGTGRAGDNRISYSQALAAAKWFFPVGELKDRRLVRLTTVSFYVAVIVVAVFLGGHTVLWARGVGVSWPAIPNRLADALTIIAVITGAALVIQYVASRAANGLSSPQDCLLPLIASAPLASGFFVMHPALNPFSYEVMLLVHVVSASILLVLIPVAKLSRTALTPRVPLAAEVARRRPPDAGDELGETLQKGDESI